MAINFDTALQKSPNAETGNGALNVGDPSLATWLANRRGRPADEAPKPSCAGVPYRLIDFALRLSM